MAPRLRQLTPCLGHLPGGYRHKKWAERAKAAAGRAAVSDLGLAWQGADHADAHGSHGPRGCTGSCSCTPGNVGVCPVHPPWTTHQLIADTVAYAWGAVAWTASISGFGVNRAEACQQGGVPGLVQADPRVRGVHLQE